MGTISESDNLTALHYMTYVVCQMSYFMSYDVRKVSDALMNKTANHSKTREYNENRKP